MHPPVRGSKIPPKLYGTNLLKNPDFTLDRKEIARVAAIEKLPGWVDKTVVKKHMNRKRRRPNASVNVDGFEKNAEKAFAKASYS